MNGEPRKWLIITLAAPFASFGEEAGNVRRGTTDRPTRSALLGLAGAALGIDRADAEGQRALAASFRVATRTLCAGTLVTDFHTYQSLPSAKGRPHTRAEALSHPLDLATSITQREYRTDVRYQAAYRAISGGQHSLQDLKIGFEKPAYTLYLGRKSCPLSHPLAPEIIEAQTVIDAFKRHSDGPNNPSAGLRTYGLIAVEDRADLGSPDAPLRTRLRMDEPSDRTSWQFGQRREYEYVPTDQAEASQ